MARFINVTLFAVQRDNKDKKKFTRYFGDLVKKDGTIVRTGVKFRQSCDGPKREDCPCNIVVNVEDANLANRYDKERDKVFTTLWVSNYTMGEPYEDHSLDDF